MKKIKIILLVSVLMLLMCSYFNTANAQTENLIADEYLIDNMTLGAMPETTPGSGVPASAWETDSSETVAFEELDGNVVISASSGTNARISYNYLGKIPAYTDIQVWEIKFKLPENIGSGELDLFNYHRGYNFCAGIPIVIKNGTAVVKDAESSTEICFAENIESGKWYKAVRIMKSNMVNNDAEAINQTKNYIYDEDGNLVGSTGDEWIITGGVSALGAYTQYAGTGIYFSSVSFVVKNFSEKVYLDDFAVYDASISYTLSEDGDSVNQFIAYNSAVTKTMEVHLDTNLNFANDNAYKKYRRYKMDFRVPKEENASGEIKLFGLATSSAISDYSLLVANNEMYINDYVNGAYEKTAVIKSGSTSKLYIENGVWYSVNIDVDVSTGTAELTVYNSVGGVIAQQEFTSKIYDARTLYVSYIKASGYGENMIYIDNLSEEAWVDSFDGSNTSYIKWAFDGTNVTVVWNNKTDIQAPVAADSDMSTSVTNFIHSGGRWVYYTFPSGQLTILQDNFLLSGDISEETVIKLQYTAPIDTSNLDDAIKLFKGSEEVRGYHFWEYDDSSYTLLIKFNPLDGESVYSINIDGIKSLEFGVDTESFLFTFNETPSYMAVLSSKFLDLDGEPVTSISKDDTVTAKMNIKNISNFDRSYMLMAGLYSNNSLKAVYVKDITIEPGENIIETENIEIPYSDCVLRITIWDSWFDMNAACDAFQISTGGN